MENLGIARNVTLFSASDFGGALLSNGDGSDQDWGGHHFIVGGAVQSGSVSGQLPDVALPLVLPNIRNFSQRDMGFMAAS